MVFFYLLFSGIGCVVFNNLALVDLHQDIKIKIGKELEEGRIADPFDAPPF